MGDTDLRPRWFLCRRAPTGQGCIPRTHGFRIPTASAPSTSFPSGTVLSVSDTSQGLCHGVEATVEGPRGLGELLTPSGPGSLLGSPWVELPSSPSSFGALKTPPSRGKLTGVWVPACREAGEGKVWRLWACVCPLPGWGALPRSRALRPLRTTGMGSQGEVGVGTEPEDPFKVPRFMSPQLPPLPNTSLIIQPILRIELLTFPCVTERGGR